MVRWGAEKEINTMNAKPNLDRFAAALGVTRDQIDRQLEKNKAQLQEMAAKARQTGRKVNGYTAEQLEQLAFR